MKRYNADILSEITGLSLIGATLDVLIAGTETRITLYANDDDGGATVSQPVPNGVSFYVPDGRYDLRAKNGNRIRLIPLVDMFDGFEQNRRLEAVENGEPGAQGSLRADLLEAQGGAKVNRRRGVADAVMRSINMTVGQDVEYSPFEFGAVGDGVTDDTIALQKWAAASVRDRRALILPAGKFATSGISIVINGAYDTSWFKIGGAGRRLSQMLKLGISNVPVLTVQHLGNPGETHLTVSDLDIVGNAKFSDGIRLIGISYWSIRRVVANACDTSFDVVGSLIGTASESNFARSNRGIKLRKAAGGAYPNAIRIRDCVLTLNSIAGVDNADGSGVTIENCDIEGNGVIGDATTGGIVLGASLGTETGLSRVMIARNHFEGNLGPDIAAGAFANQVSVMVSENEFINNFGRVTIKSAAGGGVWTLIDNLSATPDSVCEINGTLKVLGGTYSQLTGVWGRALIMAASMQTPPSWDMSTYTASPNILSPLHIGGGGGVRWSWANQSGRYDLYPDIFNGIMRWTGNAAKRVDMSVSLNFVDGERVKMNGQQVIGPRQAAIVNAAAGTEAATINAVLAVLRTHGLIET